MGSKKIEKSTTNNPISKRNLLPKGLTGRSEP
jgi:hypothetical protein